MDWGLMKLRQTKNIRTMLTETVLQKSDLIMPIFVSETLKTKKEIGSMPGIYQHTLNTLLKEVEEIQKLGILSVILFGLPANKDICGTGSFDDNGIIQKATRLIKNNFKDMIVITDLCLCEYTSHGHCGILCADTTGKNNKNKSACAPDIDLSETLKTIGKIAVSQSNAGADIVAPSAMMDRQIAAIKNALEENNIYKTLVLSYAAKFASAFYGPFRDAAESTPAFGDRNTYQMNPANTREAMREVESDINEGADLIMVKPALSYLDIIAKVRKKCKLPLVAYNVSGEYSMVKIAAQKRLIDEVSIVNEILLSIKRAGADLIITYHAKEVAGRL